MIEPSINDLLLQGVLLMTIGMGIVLGFLVLLVGVLSLMSWAVLRWAPEESVADARAAFPRGSGGQEDRRLAAVISAAVVNYRRRHRT